MKYIRASMLPGYSDCARRAAAKQYRDLVTAAGYPLRELPPSIGAAVGTAVHAACERMALEKMATGSLGTLRDCVDVAAQKLRDEIAPGAEWDDTTPNLQTAVAQIEKLSLAFVSVLLSVEIETVEQSLRAVVADGWELTGHIDLTTTTGGIIDHKTGAVARPYQSQLGAYSLLRRSNGHTVTSASTAWAKRIPPSKPQPPAELQHYDVATCERAAFSTIRDVMRDVSEFEKSGDPEAFRANPMSMMCSARYCPAHSTNFCSMHISNTATIAD